MSDTFERFKNISDLIVVTPNINGDNRGYFFESYNKEQYRNLGIKCNFVQDNESKSKKGVLRGMHYQIGEYAQAKLVRVIKGEIFDVAVDIRENSPSFKQWRGTILSDLNKKQFFIPRGFAHGFIVLSDDAIVSYKVDNYYNKKSERGFIYNDETLNIGWPLKDGIIISEKDANLPSFKNAEKF